MTEKELKLKRVREAMRFFGLEPDKSNYVEAIYAMIVALQDVVQRLETLEEKRQDVPRKETF